MKKTLLTTILCTVALSVGYAQFADGTVLQPTHVVGRRINSSGEITLELSSDFTYSDDGKLLSYVFPEYAISANYFYSGDFLTQENIYHRAGHPNFSEINIFTYENGEIKTISHIMDQMGISKYWLYSYYDDGRLERIDLQEDDDEDYHIHWLYDYEDEGHTVIESYYTSWVSQGMRLWKKTTSRYDSNFVLFSDYTENYDLSGDLVSTKQTNYTYTPLGKLETKTTQTLTEGVWTNTSILQYSYDENNNITQQLNGAWNAETGEWYYDHKITFDYQRDAQTCTVSFYKKNNDEWVWDVFENQIILFGSHLKAQQRAIGYMVYEDMNGQGNVNQIEFTLTITQEPIYLGIEDETSLCTLYPNPTTGLVTITGHNLKTAEVFNTQGQHVATATGDGERFTADLSGQPAGVYFVNVTDKEGRKCVRKVVKE